MLHHQYNPILPVLKELVFPSHTKFINSFNSETAHPLPQYNGENINFYLSEPHNNHTYKSTKTQSISCIKSHPLLPIYLASNDKGNIGVWSFAPQKTRPLYEFSLDKDKKKSWIKKIDFNNYGSQFLTVDEEYNSASLFEFEYSLNRNLPTSTIGGKLGIRDACLSNSSGVVISTFSDYNNKYSNMWDCLLPPSSQMVSEVYEVGGNIVSKFGSNYFAVGNNTNGYIHFVDIRTLKVSNSILAHLDEVRSICFSPSLSYMFTSGKEGTVKIWDIVNLNSIEEIDCISPFIKEKNIRRIDLLHKDGCLFASGANSIKLLRNKLN